jgi:hypothetical protein
LVAVAACGRVGFAQRAAIDGGGDDDAPNATIDAIACVDGDGLCPSGCLGLDNDCVATCGDGICSGNAGEKCASCDADCNTMADVCGNGICDPDESSATCMTDCGPSPWPSAQIAIEDDFLAKLNTARAAGVTCPGTTSATIGGALARGPEDPSVMQHLAWQIAHQPSFPAGTVTCNGVGYETFGNAVGYSIGVFGYNYGTADFAVSSFLADSGTCPLIVDPGRTTVVLAVGQDLANSWVMFLR